MMVDYSSPSSLPLLVMIVIRVRDDGANKMETALMVITRISLRFEC